MKVFVFDHAKCNGCRNCQIACKDENCDNDWAPYSRPQPRTGQFWLKVNEKIRGQVPKVKASYSVSMCKHCGEAPCIEACPDGISRRYDGLILIDPLADISKEKVMDACPFDVIFWNDELSIAQKCTGYVHLIDEGWEVPRCVDVCPHDALRFGEFEDFESELEAGGTMSLGLDYKSSFYELNVPKRFIGGIAVDIEKDEVIIGAKVELIDGDGKTILDTTTDEFGDFWLNQIDDSEYEVRITHHGYEVQTIIADVREEDKNIGVIVLKAL